MAQRMQCSEHSLEKIHVPQPSQQHYLQHAAMTRKQPKCPSTDDDEWIKTVWYYPTRGYSSAIEKKVMLLAATSVDLEGIMLSEMSNKDKYCMISLTCQI